ncbi:TolC family protein [Aureispira]|nr:TolC family protein [Aureispira sp.]
MKINLLVFMTMMLVHSFVMAQQDSISLKDQPEDGEAKIILELVERLPSLEELYELAYLNSPIFKSNKISNQLYRERILSEQWKCLDLFSFAPTGYYGQVPGEATLVNTDPGGRYQLTFGLTFGFNFNLGQFAVKTRNVRIAKLELDLYETEQIQVFKALRAEISVAYFNVLTESENLTASIRIHESTGALVYLAEKRFVNGDISLADYHNVLVGEHRFTLLMTDNKRKLKEAFYKLKLLVGGKFE